MESFTVGTLQAIKTKPPAHCALNFLPTPSATGGHEDALSTEQISGIARCLLLPVSPFHHLLQPVELGAGRKEGSQDPSSAEF